MSSAEERARRAAFRLVKHAAWISPPHREEWSRAMLHELDHIPRGASALRWALGCTFVSYLERMDIMTRSLGELPRWLLSLEMAVCLVPLTWLFITLLATTARGVMPLGFGILSGSVALLGPVALVVALRLAHTGNARVGRTTITLLALLAAWTVLASSVQVLRSGIFSRNLAGLRTDHPAASLGRDAPAAGQFGSACDGRSPGADTTDWVAHRGNIWGVVRSVLMTLSQEGSHHRLRCGSGY